MTLDCMTKPACRTIALMESLAPKSEVLFSGEAGDLIREFRRHYRPFTVVQSQPGEQAAAALCENFVCQQPAHSVEELRALLSRSEQ